MQMHDPTHGVVIVESSAGAFQQLVASKFGLCPRGQGAHSFRLFETLAAGAVPVVLSNGYVLPFNDVVDWAGCALRFDEGDKELIAKLRNVSHEEWVDRHARCVHIHETYLETVEKQVGALLLNIQRRIAVARGHQLTNFAVWPLGGPADSIHIPAAGAHADLPGESLAGEGAYVNLPTAGRLGGGAPGGLSIRAPAGGAHLELAADMSALRSEWDVAAVAVFLAAVVLGFLLKRRR